MSEDESIYSDAKSEIISPEPKEHSDIHISNEIITSENIENHLSERYQSSFQKTFKDHIENEEIEIPSPQKNSSNSFFSLDDFDKSEKICEFKENIIEDETLEYGIGNHIEISNMPIEAEYNEKHTREYSCGCNASSCIQF